MYSKFFEILIDKLPEIEGLEYRKYAPSEYFEMTNSLKGVQDLMDQGKTGKEILSTSDSDNLRGISNSYTQFYNPRAGDRVKVDFNNSDDFGGYTNGRHRVEAARAQGLEYIPAEISCQNPEDLKKLEMRFGSGRDLSEFNPKQEQIELDNERFGIPSNQENGNITESTIKESQPHARSVQDQSKENESIPPSSYLGNRGNPNTTPNVAEVNGKIEPGISVSPKEMEKRTAMSNRILESMKQRSDAAFPPATDEKADKTDI